MTNRPIADAVDPGTAWSIHQVLAREAHVVDTHAWDELGSVFAPVVTVENEDGSLHGLDLLVGALRAEAELTAGAPISHHIVNTILEHEPEGVRAWSRVLLISHDQRASCVDQVDHLRHGPNGWRVVYRRSRPRRPTSDVHPETFETWRDD